MPSAADSPVRAYLLGLQSRIVAKMEALDGGTFARDEWKRDEGGGGISRILEDGKLLERAGVGFSDVTGNEASAVGHRASPADRGQAVGSDGRVARACIRAIPTCRPST